MATDSLRERKYPCPVGSYSSIAAPEDVNMQTVEVGEKREGETRIRRYKFMPDKLVTGIPDNPSETIFELFEFSLKRKPQNACLGYRPKKSDGSFGEYLWSSFAEVAVQRNNFGSGLLTLGAKCHDNIVVYSINRPEWIITEQACCAYNMRSVGLYDALGEEMIKYVVDNAEASILVLSLDKLDQILSYDWSTESSSEAKGLKHVICMESSITEEQREIASKQGIQLHTFKEIEDLGAEDPREHTPPTKEDYYCIVYTSGSTGHPKGVIITHQNALAVIGACWYTDARPTLDKEVHLSYLPLAHVAEKFTYNVVLSACGCVGCFQGAPTKLLDDIQTLRPTFIIGAPRLYQRVRAKFIQNLNAGLVSSMLYKYGFPAKRAAIEAGTTTPVWDLLLFNKLKAKLGDRLNFFISAAAPLDPALAEFLEICLGTPVIQGYGLSENFGPSTMGFLSESPINDIQCGPCMPCFEQKLRDAPEFGYTTKDTPHPRGEVMIRGPGVFKGYFKNEEATKNAVDDEGWFATEDIGLFNSRGSLQIIDRKKNMFKLAQGEYIAIELLESVYMRSSYVEQIFVTAGVIHSSFLVAVVVLDPDTVIPLATKLQIPLSGSKKEKMKALCNDAQIYSEIEKDLIAMGQEAKINGYEYIKKFHLESEPFTVDNHLLTPTFKLRRVEAKARYKDLCAELHHSYESTLSK